MIHEKAKKSVKRCREITTVHKDSTKSMVCVIGLNVSVT